MYNATLTSLSDVYIANILSFVDLLKNNIAVFDFDGTLTSFQYEADRLLPCKDNQIEDYCKQNGTIYSKIRILKTMQFVISQLDCEKVFILTKTVPSLRAAKNEVIKEYFSQIKPEHIVHTDSAMEKVHWLGRLYAETGAPIVFVEDTAKTLLDAEEILEGVRGYHISSLIA